MPLGMPAAGDYSASALRSADDGGRQVVTNNSLMGRTTMAISHEVRTSTLFYRPGEVLRANRWWLAAPILASALIAWCELHSLVTGMRLPGLHVSGPWALQVSTGWIVAAAALSLLGPRLAGSASGRAHPYAAITVGIVIIAAFTLLCEATLTGRSSSTMTFVYARLPMHFVASTLLVAAYAWRRSSTRVLEPPATESSTDEGPTHDVAPAPAPADRDLPQTLDVMTGTGRTTIRVADIECLQADRNYINVVHVSGRTYLLRQTLSAIEQTLAHDRFVRIHRSTIVNLDMIRERRSGGVLVLHSGRSVTIGRAFRDRADLPLTGVRGRACACAH